MHAIVSASIAKLVHRQHDATDPDKQTQSLVQCKSRLAAASSVQRESWSCWRTTLRSRLHHPLGGHFPFHVKQRRAAARKTSSMSFMVDPHDTAAAQVCCSYDQPRQPSSTSTSKLLAFVTTATQDSSVHKSSLPSFFALSPLCIACQHTVLKTRHARRLPVVTAKQIKQIKLIKQERDPRTLSSSASTNRSRALAASTPSHTTSHGHTRALACSLQWCASQSSGVPTAC